MNILHVGPVHVNVNFTYIGDKRPTAKDYQKFLTKHCLEWKAIGLQLGLDQALLNLREADHRDQNRECLRLILDDWLQMDVKATWSKLELAITNANRAKLNIDPLDTSKARISVYNYVAVVI